MVVKSALQNSVFILFGCGLRRRNAVSVSSSCFPFSLYCVILSQVHWSFCSDHVLVREWNEQASSESEGLLYIQVYGICLRVVAFLWKGDKRAKTRQ